jgi:hypothetical protein
MDSEVQDEVSPTPALSDLTRIYLKMRDKRDAIRREAEEKEKEIAEQMAIVEAEMLEICKEMDASSIRTPHGTIVRSVKTRYWTSDWDSMYDFIEETGAFGLLEKRIHQTHMKEFLAENPDIFPKGMNVENEFTVVVRRSKGN